MKITTSAYLTIRSLAVTLTFDLLTSKSNQFIFVTTYMEAVHLVKFIRAIFMISCPQAIFYLIRSRRDLDLWPLTFWTQNLISSSLSRPCNSSCKSGQIPVAILSIKWKNQRADHDDVEAEAERHLHDHRVQRSVDVIDAELIQRLAPEHQTEYDSQHLRHNIPPITETLWCVKTLHCSCTAFISL